MVKCGGGTRCLDWERRLWFMWDRLYMTLSVALLKGIMTLSRSTNNIYQKYRYSLYMYQEYVYTHTRWYKLNTNAEYVVVTM